MEEEKDSYIYGFVEYVTADDEEKEISDAEIKLIRAPSRVIATTHSDEHGSFYFKGKTEPNSKYNLVATASGYNSATKSITTEANGDAWAGIVLTPSTPTVINKENLSQLLGMAGETYEAFLREPLNPYWWSLEALNIMQDVTDPEQFINGLLVKQLFDEMTKVAFISTATEMYGLPGYTYSVLYFKAAVVAGSVVTIAQCVQYIYVYYKADEDASVFEENSNFLLGSQNDPYSNYNQLKSALTDLRANSILLNVAHNEGNDDYFTYLLHYRRELIERTITQLRNFDREMDETYEKQEAKDMMRNFLNILDSQLKLDWFFTTGGTDFPVAPNETPSQPKRCSGIISGQVINEDSGETVPRADIYIRDSEGTTIYSGMTDSNGYFRTSAVFCSSKSYRVICDTSGFDPWFVDVNTDENGYANANVHISKYL